MTTQSLSGTVGNDDIMTSYDMTKWVCCQIHKKGVTFKDIFHFVVFELHDGV